MFKISSRRRVAGVAMAAGWTFAIACGDPVGTRTESLDVSATQVEWAGSPELAQGLAAVREATAPFLDLNAALAAGYVQGSPCEVSAAGGMGFHYPNRPLMGITPGTFPVSGTDAVIDPLRPEVLLYEPHEDGTRRLVGVEYLVFAAAWDAVNAAPPTLFGVPFTYMAGPQAHGFAPHYELHVWLWRHNPAGMFAPWNPKVGCTN